MDKEKLLQLRHSASHIMAQAVLRHFPDAKLAIGPAIDEGFYYDFDLDEKTFSEGDLVEIEKIMSEIIKQNQKFEQFEKPTDEAIKFLEELNQPYKVELAKDLKERGDVTLGFNRMIDSKGNECFIDLCMGNHIRYSKEIKAFKLLKIAGAYWKGDEKNKMLQRIYGTAFETKAELEEYLKKLEEAKARDHRKLGKELDLFTFSDLVGAGLPMFTPKGTVIRNELQNLLLKISKKYGMLPVTIPHIAKRKLYETSGHAQKFGDELIKVISHYDEFVMKPVNCPHHTQIYASQPRSYRDLPIRYMESTMQYRDEKPGEIGGLTRVRAITVDDGHIFCTVDQIKQEAENIARIIEEFYSGLGMFGNHWVSLSVRDSNNLDAYVGEPADWDKAEAMLQEISDSLDLNARRVEGEAAIYGPKLDYMFKDSLGREFQLATIQLDFAMPKRFGLEYVNNEGVKKPPVMIHRAILGSYERFMAILIEHFAGIFPLWLSPVQVQIISVGDSFNEYANQLAEDLKNQDIRVEVDSADETVGNKIRKAEKLKVPYMLVVGEKEKISGKLTVRQRGAKDTKEYIKEDFIAQIIKEVKEKFLQDEQ